MPNVTVYVKAADYRRLEESGRNPDAYVRDIVRLTLEKEFAVVPLDITGRDPDVRSGAGARPAKPDPK